MHRFSPILRSKVHTKHKTTRWWKRKNTQTLLKQMMTIQKRKKQNYSNTLWVGNLPTLKPFGLWDKTNNCTSRQQTRKLWFITHPIPHIFPSQRKHGRFWTFLLSSQYFPKAAVMAIATWKGIGVNVSPVWTRFHSVNVCQLFLSLICENWLVHHSRHLLNLQYGLAILFLSRS